MKRKSPLYLYVLFALLLSLELGCAKKPDDAKITSDVQSKFGQDSGLSSKQLSIQAANGVVTLNGTVDNDAQRNAASQQAAAIPGVKTVVNNLQIGPAPADAQAAQPAPETAVASPAESPKPAPAKKPKKSSHSDDAQNSNKSQMAENTPPPPPPKKYIIDQGTQLTVRLVDAIDSEKNQTGDTFHATLNAPLTSDGEEAVPAGSDVTGHLIEVKSAGKFAGRSSVIAQLDSLTFGGRTYNLQTDQYKKEGSSRGKNTAEKVGAGAAIGGIIGAIAGGGKGAAIGAAAGAGVGGGVQAASKSEQIKLPSETVLNFVLQQPVTVVQAPSTDANRQKLQGQQ